MQLTAYEASVLHHVRQQVTSDLAAGLVPATCQTTLSSEQCEAGGKGGSGWL